MADPYDADVPEEESPIFRHLLASLHYGYPAAVFIYYTISSTIAVCTLQTRSTAESKDHPRRRFISWLLMLGILSWFAQLGYLLFVAVAEEKFPPAEQDVIIGLLSCALVFGVQFAGLWEAEKAVVLWPYMGSVGMGMVFEPVLVWLTWKTRVETGGLGFRKIFDFSAAGARWAAFGLVLMFYFEGVWNVKREKATDMERQGLLNKTNGHVNGVESDGEERSQNGYGATSDSSTDASQSPTTDAVESPWERRERQANEAMEKRLKEKGNWVTYAKSFLVFFPYVWPVNHRSLQVRVVLVGVCLLAMNAINVLIPRQMGIIMDSLAGDVDRNPWTEVMIFAGLKLVASEAGLSLLRQWLWIPVEYYSFDAMSTAAYSHVLNLSSDFHDSKSSSDIMMAIQSGQSISNMLESICFQAVPMLIDMTVAFIYLSYTFGPYEGFITIATAAVFLYIATRMISKLKSARRGEVSAWFKEHYVRQAGIQGWSTVTCFNQVGHEEARYSEAVKDRVAKSQKVYFGYVVAYAFQFLVLLSGLLAGAFLAVYQITHGQVTPGKFIMLLTYWAQLVAPLTFFAGLGKTISKDLIHAEQLLEIMQTKPTIKNKEGAPPLHFTGGRVKFENVCFSYDKKKEILRNIDFEATPGMTVAFVGATGAGKSTILKLLDRFYDVTKGSITIDGQDIRDVDLFSLRGQIGIVPQSPILFDDTIMNNVRYAKLTATDEEVHEACKAASIHEQIMGFSDGYNTRVGERGVKLSGGELQRVAIARAILKRPAIVLLDEATSAVDTETEQKIQEALRTLCKGRTTFIVAHRLSTIMNADRIIVVGGGEIVEQGSHEELILQEDGKYAELWSKQIFVKPKDSKDSTPDGTRSPVKGRKAPNIVNDLSAEATNSVLAKVTNKPSVQTNGDVTKDPSSAVNGSVGSENTKPASGAVNGHKKEDTSSSSSRLRLNPGAPTFMPRISTTTPSSPVGRVVDRSFGNDSPRVVPLTTTPAPPLSPVAPLPRGLVPPPGVIPPNHHVQFFATPVVMVPAGAAATPYPLFPPGGGLPLSSSLGVRQTQQQRVGQDVKQQYWGKVPSTVGMMGMGLTTTPRKPRLDWKSISPRTPESDDEEDEDEKGKPTCFDDDETKGKKGGGDGDDEKDGEVRGYFPFYSRRIQSKSEPSGSGQGVSRSPTEVEE
ncbi:hypothetical protein QC762_102140 [Podospora pseudocomata]|uniref:Heavy metal tolerance protein n=1 Tax=Podospora pseudocomata TaxID=2093779 RepID=A0ABR0GRW9_9PEZI|nr:hypothetical protein QC762_102140 [Podospora pseudocomata]